MVIDTITAFTLSGQPEFSSVPELFDQYSAYPTHYLLLNCFAWCHLRQYLIFRCSLRREVLLMLYAFPLPNAAVFG